MAIPKLLALAEADGVLPAEHAAAALWWRLSRHLSHGEFTGTARPPRTSSTPEQSMVRETQAPETDLSTRGLIQAEALNQRLAAGDPSLEPVPSLEERTDFKRHNQAGRNKESATEGTELASAVNPHPYRTDVSRRARQEHLRSECLRPPRPPGPSR